ncbi:hypothetical protein K8I31_12435, partial [bacterium]|nr:hypothetical protein [bacterium]
MKVTLRLFSIVAVCLFVMQAGAGSELRQRFENPPDDALPRGYWLWPNSHFDYAAIREELKSFKEMGLGGVDIFDLGVQDRNDVIPPGPGFVSEEQVDGIAFALQEAKTLGLKIGLIASSSWNAGASWTKPEDALMNLVAWREVVEGPHSYQKKLPFPELPTELEKPYGKYPLHVPRDDDGLPVYHKPVGVFAFPLDGENQIAAPEKALRLDGAVKDGVLSFDIPEGRWLLMRVECTNFGQVLWLPSDGSAGLIMDHFNKQATRNHFNEIIDRLERRVGPLENTALERLYLCSYESDAEVLWTPAMSEEFLARNGYAIEPYIPALFGYEVKDKNTTERFLYDFRRAVSDIFVDNVYREASSICRDHGMLLCSESGGPGPPLHNVPTEDLKALGAVDVMRGEFWNRGEPWKDEDGFNLMQVVKGIASAAHIYGRSVVEMEAFTSRFHWREGPMDFKPLADQAFCEGMTRVVYHTMSHNLPEAGKPGWTYQAGTHINTNLTWWPMSKPLHAYFARCSAMLQSGRFSADAAYYYGHEIPNFAKPKHVRPDLGPGYDYDDLNTEALLTASVREGRVALPGGMEYSVLVLPNSERMDLAVMQKIEALIDDGATVIGPKPNKIYGLVGYPQDEDALNQIAARIWGEADGAEVDRTYGKGRIVNGKTAREVLLEQGVGPDLQVVGAAYSDIDFIHRITDDGDLYFVRNVNDLPLSIDCVFRTSGAAPQLWDPVSCETHQAAIYQIEDDGVRLPLTFGPY